MKKIYLIILFINLILAQSSSLSLYGLGERIISYDSNALSLGGLRLFSSNKSDFILSSPSSYYNNYNTSLSMTVSFNTINAKSNSGIENLTLFVWSFPTKCKLILVKSFLISVHLSTASCILFSP